MKHEKIKQSELAVYRTNMLKQQRGDCAICGFPVRLKDQALDHDHSTGRIRGVLHRDCNILLGKIENYTSRHGKRLVTDGRLDDFIGGVRAYMVARYDHNPLHPRHLTDDDKLARKYRRLIKKSVKPETKQKYRDLLKELNDER